MSLQKTFLTTLKFSIIGLQAIVKLKSKNYVIFTINPDLFLNFYKKETQ